MTGNLITAMIPETGDTSCPAPSRFWEVAGGDSWQTGERLHIASCPRCQAAERSIRSAVGHVAEEPKLSSLIPTDLLESVVLATSGGATERFAHKAESLEVSYNSAEVSRFETGHKSVDQFNCETATSGIVDGAEVTIADEHTGTFATGSGSELHWTKGRSDVPSRLGDYEVISEIGSGGMGTVYKVRDVALNRFAALKVIRHFDVANGGSVDRFFRAARLWARLIHPSIVPIYGVGQIGELPYVVSQYVEGETLAAYERRGDRIASVELARMIADVADALQVAHEQGVIHRDIKPSNIMIDREHRPLLIDFGLARSSSSDVEATLSHEGTILGTPAFMSPEQAQGNPDAVGPAADVYSLGATLYTLLAGRPPFRGQSVVETLQLLMSVDPVPPSRFGQKIPRDIETICLKALAKEPGKRYATARDMADDLRRFQHGRPIRGRAPGAMERAARFLRRHRLVSCMGLLSVAALAFGAYEQFDLRTVRSQLHSADARLNAATGTSGRDARRMVNRAAEAELRKAIAVGEAHVQDHSEEGERPLNLARAYRRLGDVFVNTDRFSEAKWAYERAVKLLRQSFQVDGDNALLQKELADVFCNLGEASRALGQTHHACELYREAVLIRRRLVADHSDVSAYRDELAHTLDRLNWLSQEPPALAP
jgi:Protein kinase domain